MNEGYTRATSLNLPNINLNMFLKFFQSNPLFNDAELRGTKTAK